jgi:hypothetical protein
MNEIRDFCGNLITVGCKCAYPMRRGSKMWMTTVKVDGVQQTGDTTVLSGYDNLGRRTHTKNILNCIVIS